MKINLHLERNRDACFVGKSLKRVQSIMWYYTFCMCCNAHRHSISKYDFPEKKLSYF